MLNALIGSKINQSQAFTTQGKRIPVTTILVGPAWVLDVKKQEIDGYSAVRIGFGIQKSKNISQAKIGVFKKAGLDKVQPRFLREIKINDNSEYLKNIKGATPIKVDEIFKEGDIVSVTGISKGKGFAGVVKRHGFAGGPRTHGQSDRERAPGSIGQSTTPGRVYKGKRMAGRMGQDKVTIKNLKVIGVDAQNNRLTVSGLVAGGRNSLLIVKKFNETRKIQS